MTTVNCVHGTPTAKTQRFTMVCVTCGGKFTTTSKMVKVCGACDTKGFTMGVMGAVG